MMALLVGAWLFYMLTFCALGVVYRHACRGRVARGGPCVCGRHVAGGEAPPGGARLPRASRLRSAEARVRWLQDRYVAGLLSMEQYELELDKVVGLP